MKVHELNSLKASGRLDTSHYPCLLLAPSDFGGRNSDLLVDDLRVGPPSVDSKPSHRSEGPQALQTGGFWDLLLDGLQGWRVFAILGRTSSGCCFSGGGVSVTALLPLLYLYFVPAELMR